MRRNNAREREKKDKDSAEGDADLWGSILRQAATTKPAPTCNLIVLGTAQSGKSTLMSAIGHQDAQSQQMEPLESMTGLAMQFAYAHVYDDSDAEEAAALVNLFEMDGPVFAPLLRFALPPYAIDRTAVVICLDWSRPWAFMDQLEQYLVLLEREMADIAAHMREKIESDFREYREPDADGNTSKFNTATMDANISTHNVTLPLGQGVLTNNLGIPIIVVCTKADYMISLEKERGYGDGTFDYIQQSLRTICLKYGAALFYTSSFRPKTIACLRSYILHKLLRNTDHANSFPFPYRAEVIDRESVRVPSGWDNWGLIRVQGGSFNCEAMAGLMDTANGGSGELAHGYVSSMAQGRALYESEIQDSTGNKASISFFVIIHKPSQAKKPIVAADDEQTFLERNLELLNSMSTGNPSGTASPFAGASESFAQRLASSNLSSSDMMEDVSAKLAKLAKMKDQNTPAAIRSKLVGPTDLPMPSSPSPQMPFSLPANAGLGATPMSPGSAASAAAAGGAGGAANNEVLSNFFQSLLNKKGSVPGASGAVPTMGARAPSVGAALSSIGRTPSVGSALGFNPSQSQGSAAGFNPSQSQGSVGAASAAASVLGESIGSSGRARMEPEGADE
ncbi:hypothetical protein HDU81_010565 [Chytriomyces hyalinus]|nr:hypothetical protein HDU81_010565 [Chytriomyces hyalinus]